MDLLERVLRGVGLEADDGASHLLGQSDSNVWSQCWCLPFFAISISPCGNFLLIRLQLCKSVIFGLLGGCSGCGCNLFPVGGWFLGWERWLGGFLPSKEVIRSFSNEVILSLSNGAVLSFCSVDFRLRGVVGGLPCSLILLFFTIDFSLILIHHGALFRGRLRHVCQTLTEALFLLFHGATPFVNQDTISVPE